MQKFLNTCDVERFVGIFYYGQENIFPSGKYTELKLGDYRSGLCGSAGEKNKSRPETQSCINR